ncbi:MAG: V-type ATP synthase subunit D [Verrucomicrobia bacterium ADurb.Bin345]|nr:MAG: V-type ATP synthase subunit D [Verrucomicrobia bacterium ADurb.Bin345]
MSRIKHTKTELKAQRDALRRFERYLPTLQLKKQQLQLEVRNLEAQLEKKRAEERLFAEALAPWIRLFAEQVGLDKLLRVKEIRTSEGNIAGVTIPVLEGIDFDRSVPDLFRSPSWVDEGLDAMEAAIRFAAEIRILEEELRALGEELRTTTQRVNLFEKVKIPESAENIRVIRIYLGDEQTADVVRGKIAKGRSVEKVRSA